MYTVYRMESGMPDMIIGVAKTTGEAANMVEEDREWLGRTADYRWHYDDGKPQKEADDGRKNIFS